MSIQVLDVYAGNKVDFAEEKACGIDGVIIKAGQGQYPQYHAEKCDFIDQCKALGLPWGVYWVVDARYSPESHKATIKQYWPDGEFGPLGPVARRGKAAHRHARGHLQETAVRILQTDREHRPCHAAHSKTGVGVYTSPGQWQLCSGNIPYDKQLFFAALPLWTAQFKTATIDLYGAWTKAVMWQYQGEPDYSRVLDVEWWTDKVGAPTPPPPAPPQWTIQQQSTDRDRDEVPMTQYVRFKYRWRPTPFPIPPATVVGAARPGAQKGGPAKLSARLQAAIRSLNSVHAAAYILKDRSGWVNAMPNAESVAFAGNIAKVITFERGSYLLETMLPTDELPHAYNRLLVHRFTCVDFLGRPRQPGDSFDAWVFLLAVGPFWVKASDVDVFTHMPEPVWPGALPADMAGYLATVQVSTVIRQRADVRSGKVGLAPKGTIVTVLKEVNGWAQVGNQRFIILTALERTMSDTLTQIIAKLQPFLLDDGTLFTTATCTAAIRQALAHFNIRMPVQGGTIIDAVSDQYIYELDAALAGATPLTITTVHLQDPSGNTYDTPLPFQAYSEDERYFFRLVTPQPTGGHMIVRFTANHTINGLDSATESTMTAEADTVLLDAAAAQACTIAAAGKVMTNNLDPQAPANYRAAAALFSQSFEKGLTALARRRRLQVSVRDLAAWNDEWHSWPHRTI